MTQTKLPQHLAVICDGNRRWAREHGKTPIEGHREAVLNAGPKLIKHVRQLGIPYLTLWLFSTENWARAKDEVEGLMNLFKYFGVAKLVKEANALQASVRFIGRLTDFDQTMQDMFQQVEAQTAHNQELTIIAAMSYGGRDEITRGFQKILAEQPDLKPEQITEDLITQNLDTGDFPPADLIIRTSGEQRMSGFLAWSGVYAEYYFSQKKLPEFTPTDLDEALADYADRGRRFGH